jgi:hypothetical protein
MFIRWQRRVRTRQTLIGWGDAGDIRWTAILAESVRVDGKPRQRHVAFLGSYVEHHRSPAGDCLCRAEFWDTVSACLDRLHNRISAVDRKKIEAAIAKVQKRPTAKQREIAERQSAKVVARVRARFGLAAKAHQ